jgi:type II secretory pathway component PulF
MITPGHLNMRADLYHQLSQVTASGIGLIQALEIQHQHPPHRSMRQPLGVVLQRLETGQTLNESLGGVPEWIPLFDRALINAGESSGRLPSVFEMLANYYREKARLARQFLAFTAYPALVFHMAVFLFPIDRFTGLILQGEVIAFLLQKLMVLAPLYLVIGVLIYLFQSTRAQPVQAVVERITGFVPFLGAALRAMSLARLSAALEAMISSGVTVFQSWELAGAASGSPGLSREVQSFRPRWEAGEPPSESLQRSPYFPEMFSNQYASGEMSGKLDANLCWLHKHYEEEGSRKMRQALMGAAALIFGCVVILVAWQVISFWVGYFQRIQEVIPD